MSNQDPKQFQRKIYQNIDEKLRKSSWKSGASEAHGLLTGLACRGVTTQQLANKIYLFQVESDDAAGEYLTLLEGLFELIIRDLNSSQPTFDVLIPEDDDPLILRVDELTNWCGGYIQGFCHDGDHLIRQRSIEAQEMIQNIMDISGMQLGHTEIEAEEQERALTEVEEFLRIGIQFIYDETVNNLPSSPHTSSTSNISDEIH